MTDHQITLHLESIVGDISLCGCVLRDGTKWILEIGSHKRVTVNIVTHCGQLEPDIIVLAVPTTAYKYEIHRLISAQMRAHQCKIITIGNIVPDEYQPANHNIIDHMITDRCTDGYYLARQILQYVLGNGAFSSTSIIDHEGWCKYSCANENKIESNETENY